MNKVTFPVSFSEIRTKNLLLRKAKESFEVFILDRGKWKRLKNTTDLNLTLKGTDLIATIRSLE
jgi:hypothetical protein